MLEWLGRLPPEELDRRPRLLLAAAWTLAISGRHAEGARLVARIVAQPDVDDALHCECAFILCGSAVFADDPDRLVELFAPWVNAPPLRHPILLQLHANYTALLLLHEGEPALARLRQQPVLNGDCGDGPSYATRWGEYVIGLTYLREGQVLLVERRLRPTLVLAEADLERRRPFACMVAAVLAAALWEMDRPAEATTVLANRLDVLDHSGNPETVLLGYRTMANVVQAGGAEHRALELLEAMHAVGVARCLTRLCVASLAEQVRVHASRFRSETCRKLAERIDTVLADPSLTRGGLWRRGVDLFRDMAHGDATIAAQEWQRALDPLARADAAAQQFKDGSLHIKLLGLRALALDQCGENAQALLREAADLAKKYGLLRMFTDAHPALADLMRRFVPSGAGDSASLLAPMRAPPAAGSYIDTDEPEYQKVNEHSRVKGFNSMPSAFRELSPSYRAANIEGTKAWEQLEHAAFSGNRLGPKPANKINWTTLARIKAPTLFIAGGADLAAPPTMMRLVAERVPNADMVVMPDVGHSPYWEQPAAFNALVLDFLRKHARR